MPRDIVTAVVAGVLTVLGLGPHASTNPAVPVAPANPFADLLFAASRRLFNLPATSSPTQIGQDKAAGLVTGTSAISTAARASTVVAAPASTSALTTTSTAARPNVLGALIQGIVRLVSVLTNTPPVTGTPTVGTPNAVTGAVTGTLGFTDRNGDRLTYATTMAPTRGVVTVGATGAFSYNPTPAARQAAAATGAPASATRDSFTVTASDGRGGTARVSVTVTVSPANSAPVAGTPTVGTPSTTTGIVTGTLGFTDRDGDRLTYATTTVPRNGTVVLGATGGFAYAPTDAARHAASAVGASPGAYQDVFTVTANDGRGGVTPVSVTVTISPRNDVPVAGVPDPGEPDPATGVVRGSLGFTDADGDPLAYTTTTRPGSGAVIVDEAGGFAYTPTDGARLAAAANTTHVTDSFTVTADDGHGGVTPVAVVVTVSPVPGATVGTPSATTGVIVGMLGFTRPVGGVLGYVVTPPVSGTVTIDATGAYTYTPTAAARLAAGTTPTTDSFTVTASDGQTATITVPVDPARAYAATKIPVTDPPTAVTISPDGKTAYVAGGGLVMVVDTATNSEIAVIGVRSPSAVAISPGGKTLYVATGFDNNVVVIDTATNMITSTVQVGRNPVALAVSPDGETVYVANQFGRSVSAIDTATNTATNIFGLSGPVGVAVSPDGNTLYVANQDNNSLAVIDTATQAVTARIDVGGFPTAITLSPNGTRAYVTNGFDNTVSVIDTATNTVTATVGVGGFPYAVAVSPDGSLVYATNSNDNTVSVIDTTTNTVAATVGVGAFPAGIAVTPDSTRAYLANGFDNSVSVISLSATSIAPKAGTPTIGSPSAATGAVDGALGFSDPTNSALTYRVTSGPSYGTVTVDAAGSYTYTPTDAARHDAATPTGAQQDSFTITASNGQATAPVSVTVAIGSRNDAPIASTPTTGTISAATGVVTGTVGLADPDNDPLTYAVRTAPGKGSVILTTTGGYTYTPNQVDRLSAGTASTPVTDTFTVTANDGHGGLTEQTVTVTVRPAYPAPASTPTVGTPDAGTGIVTGTLGFTSAAPTTPLAYAVTGNPANGTVAVDAGGGFTYTPTDVARHTAAATGAPITATQDTFTVTADDGFGGVTAKTITVAVGGANVAPTAGTATVVTTSSFLGLVTGSLAVADPDADTLTYAVTTGPTQGTVYVDSTGAYRYLPTRAARLAAGASTTPVTDTFAITANDGHGGQTIQTVTVTVSPDQPYTPDTVVATVGVGTTPVGITLSPNGTRAYVTNSSADSVDVIDTATNTVIATVVVGLNPNRIETPLAVAITPDGKYAYVTVNSGNHLTVIDTATNTIVRQFTVGSTPAEIVFSADGKYAYVGTQQSVAVVDTARVLTATNNGDARNAIIANIPANLVRGMALTPDGTRLYAVQSSSNDNSVLVIDTATNTVLDTIGVGVRPTGVAITTDGRYAYVTNSSFTTTATNTNINSVSVIDADPASATYNTVVATVGVGRSPNGVAISPDGRYAYAVSSGDNNVSVIDTATNTVVDTIVLGGLGTQPQQIAISPDGTYAYVTIGGPGKNSVSVIALGR